MMGAVTSPASASASRIRASLLWLLPVFIAVALLLYGRGVFQGYDDADYLRYARDFAAGMRPEGAGHNPAAVMRLPVWMPPAALVRLGMPVYSAGVAWMWVCSLGSIAIMAAAWPGLSRGARAWSAGMLMLTPLWIRNAETLLPDVPMALFALVAVWFYRKAQRNPGGRGAWFWTGVFIGLGTLAKQPAFLLFPALAVHHLAGTRQRPLRTRAMDVATVGLGGFVILVLALCLLEWWTGRGGILLRTPGKTGPPTSYYIQHTADRFYYLKMMLSAELLPIGPILLASAVVCLVGRREQRLEAAIGLGYLAFLCAGSVSLREYVRPTQHLRYIVPCLPFWAICAGRLMDDGVRVWGRAAGRPAPWRWPAAACGMGVVVLAITIGLGSMRPQWPVERQREILRSPWRDEGRTVYVTEAMLRRYDVLLDDRDRANLSVLKGLGTLGGGSTLVLRDRWDAPRVRAQDPVRWDCLDEVRVPGGKRNVFEALVDRVRRIKWRALGAEHPTQAPLRRFDLNREELGMQHGTVDGEDGPCPT